MKILKNINIFYKSFTSCFKLIKKFLSRIDKNRHVLFYVSAFSSGVTFFSKVEILFRGNESFLLQEAYVRLTKASLFALLDTIVFHSNLTPLDLCLRYWACKEWKKRIWRVSVKILSRFNAAIDFYSRQKFEQQLVKKKVYTQVLLIAKNSNSMFLTESWKAIHPVCYILEIILDDSKIMILKLVRFPPV